MTTTRPVRAPLPQIDDDLRDVVRRRYADAAAGLSDCCGTTAPADGRASDPPASAAWEAVTDGDTGRFGASLYGGEVTGLPTTAVVGSLGCGSPTEVAELAPGEVVLDLGSGAGLDVLLSARRVGPTGIAYGLDMTDEMLEVARANAAEAGATNAVFLKGEIEAIPLADAAVDVVLSNCVINLSTDKPAVFRELARVVRPGGRLAISDVVADDDLTLDERTQRGSFVGCIAGALSFGEYRRALTDAGFVEVTVTPTHEVAQGMHAAIVRGVRSG
jgi:arsenite methyltransferase